MLRTRRMVAQLAICCVGLSASGLALGTAVADATPTGSTTAPANKPTATTTSTTVAKKRSTTPTTSATNKSTTPTTSATAVTKKSTTTTTVADKKSTVTTAARKGTIAKTGTAAKTVTPTSTAGKSTTATAVVKKSTATTAPKTASRAAAVPVTVAPPTTAPVTSAAATPPVADPSSGYAGAALVALRSGDSGGYNAALSHLAGNLSGRVGVSAAVLQSAWKAGSKDGMLAMLSGLSQLGVAYQYNAATPGVAFDCSGLASWAWSQAGVDLPHQSLMILDLTTPETIADVKPGDMVYYPGHVMISLGVGGAIVHAASTTKGVIVSVVSSTHAGLQIGDPTPAT